MKNVSENQASLHYAFALNFAILFQLNEHNLSADILSISKLTEQDNLVSFISLLLVTQLLLNHDKKNYVNCWLVQKVLLMRAWITYIHINTAGQ